MATPNSEFDPYYRWLGIPKEQQPPTHYRLLGLDHGEKNVVVIEEAVIRQTTQVRAYQIGPHAAHCTKLLNEIARAQQILANPRKREEYDRTFAQPKANVAVPIAAPVENAVVENAVVGDSIFELPQTVARPESKSGKGAGSKESQSLGKPNALLVYGLPRVGALLLGALCLVIWMRTLPSRGPNGDSLADLKKPDESPNPVPGHPTQTIEPKVEPKGTAEIPRFETRKTDLPKTEVAKTGSPKRETPEVPKEAKINVDPRAMVGDWIDEATGRRLFVGTYNGMNYQVIFFRMPTEQYRQLAYSFTPTFNAGILSYQVNAVVQDGVADPGFPHNADSQIKCLATGELLETIELLRGRVVRTYRRVDPPPMLMRLVGDWIGKDGTRDFRVKIERRGSDFTTQLTVSSGGRILPIRTSTVDRLLMSLTLHVVDATPPDPDQPRLTSLTLATTSLTHPTNAGSTFGNLYFRDPEDEKNSKIRAFYFRRATPGDALPTLETPPEPKTELAPPIVVKAKTRSEVPPDGQIAKAVKTLHEQFAKDFRLANNIPVERTALAEKLLKMGKEFDGNPVERYVILSEARDLSCAGGNWSGACDALDALAELFTVDVTTQRAAALKLLVLKNASSTQVLEEAVEASLKNVQELLLGDQFDGASKFASIGQSAASSLKNFPQQAQFRKLAQEIKAFEVEFEKMNKGLASLTAGEDEAAHLDVGRYLVLRKGEWQAGLTHLAKAGNRPLALVARLDLENPSEAARQQKAGDEWYKLAEREKERPLARAALLSRAAHWYRQAAPSSTGSALVGIKDRLKEIEEMPPPLAANQVAFETRTFKGHSGPVVALIVTGDGSKFYSAGADGFVRTWDIASGKVLTAFSINAPIQSFELSPDGSQFATTSSQGLMRLWTNSEKPTLVTTETSAHPGVHWFGKAKMNWLDGGAKLRLRDNTTTLQYEFTLNFEPTRLLGRPGGGPTLILGKNDFAFGNNFGTDEFGSPTMTVRLPNAGCAAVALNNSFAAIGGIDNTISQFMVAKRRVVRQYTGLKGSPSAIAISGSSRRIAAGGDDKTVLVWDVENAQVIERFPQARPIAAIASFAQHATPITAITFVNYEPQVLSAGSDGIIRLWNVPRENNK
jgi:hypothetical protein